MPSPQPPALQRRRIEQRQARQARTHSATKSASLLFSYLQLGLYHALMIGMQSYKATRARRRTLPNWTAVQRGQDAGKTLAELWRDYAATAALPYGLPGFYVEFRKWQSAAPENPAEEYAASDLYWNGRTAVRPDIFVLGDGAALRVRGGHLEVYSCGETRYFDAGPHHRKPKVIIFAGWGGLLQSKPLAFVSTTG